MNRLVIGLLISCILAVFAVNAHATTYVVAQGHVRASDANPGSESMPWKTIDRGIRGIKPGDTLEVKRGTYREQVVLSRDPWTYQRTTYGPCRSGKGPSEMIRIVAAAGEEVTIKGSDVVSDWTPHRDAIWVKENWATNSQQLFCDGEILQQIGGRMVPQLMGEEHFKGRKGEGLKDLEAGSFYFDEGSKKLYIWLKGGDNPNRHLIEASVRPFLLTTRGVDYVHVSGFKMRHSNTSAYSNWAAVRIDGSFNILEGLDIAWCDFGGLTVERNNNTVLNCRINFCGDNGIGGDGWGHRFLNCETSGNNYRHFTPDWHSGGIKITSCSDVLVSGHRALNNLGPGIWFDAYASNVTIQNCVVRNNESHGIIYEISGRGVIKNNISVKNKGRGIYISNSEDTVVAHNLCFGNGMSGIVVIGVERKSDFGRAEDGNQPARNNVVWGNVLVDNCHPALALPGWTTRPELIMPVPTINSNSGNVSDHNLFYRSEGRYLPFWYNWGTPSFDDLAKWSRETGQDRHSILAKPLFVNPTKEDFRPTPRSPAIGMVRPLMSVQEDANGIPYNTNSARTAGPFVGGRGENR